MKIAICIKQVPVVSMLRFDNDSRRVVREGVPNEVNPFDVLAVSAAAELRRHTNVEAVVYTMGPPQAEEALVQCLAMGMDRAVHLVDRAFAGSDTLATARALALALRREPFDLILCGRNSVDAETGQVGPETADMLGLPQVTGVRRLELDAQAGQVVVERETDEGHERLLCPLPALLTVTEGVAPETFPRPDAVEAARALPIEQVTAADLSDDPSLFGMDGSPTWVGEVYSEESDRDAIVVRNEPVDASVARLMEYLEERGVFDDSDEADGTAISRGPVRERGETGSIWVVAELLGGGVRPVTLELLGRASELANRLGTNVEAVLIGDAAERHAAFLAAHGADLVRLADDPRLARYDTESHTAILARAVAEHAPYAVLLGATANGLDLAARLAARLELGLTGDCIGLDLDDEGRLVQLKPAFGGSVVAPILSRTLPQMATVRPGILTPAAPDFTVPPAVRPLDVGEVPEPRVRLLESVSSGSAEGAELEHASVVVSVGMGIGGPENIGVARDLADALGGSLGATRDLVDAGWMPRQHQVGLSGKSVSPRLYVAIALRGPLNHTVGIRKAATVVAVNNSARAPIFRAADFGIVGDYAEVVPALTEAVKARRS